MTQEKIVVVDFGGQYNQLIARRIRQCHVYSEVVPYTTSLETLKDESVKGIIFTGGPNSVYLEGSPKMDERIYSLGKPILGICYGAQLISHQLGGEVVSADVSEYGRTELTTLPSRLFNGVDKQTEVFMSHTDRISKLPSSFRTIAYSKDCPIAAFECVEKDIYGTQYHPEVTHSIQGQKVLENFVYDICHCKGEWKGDTFIQDQVQKIREQVKDKKVLLGLSGGVDSAVAAALLSKAIGKNLYCVFVDHGLLRKKEAEEVERVFGASSSFDLNFIKVDASELFYEKLKGVTEPERKRKIIGATFIEVFENETNKLSDVEFLAQGTIYPDRIESGLGVSATIKSHHNVGGLPKNMKFKGLVEPLKDLFKDEVREIGLLLGLPESIVYRQPFPGPGLGIRIIGDVTPEKIQIVQDADYIFREEIKKAGIDREISQYFAALSNMRSVGVMGDFRTYDYAIVLRAVQTDDFMTAKPYPLPYDLLTRIMERIINEVKGVNRVLYDFTSKPPSTIELE
ncbi:MAG: glutamine-hydrolyzing GMP synthase [Bacilli bacterium]|nr:glutamine-hydrolyzing GMP synthase [Bacilli bacterium]